MQNLLILMLAAAVLTACAEKSKVAVTNQAATVQTKSRSEPIFYNGKNYLLRYDYNDGANVFDMKVSGQTAAMGAGQQKDAVAIATSSLGYFACPDGQSGRLMGEPKFSGGTWALQARCG
jgi:hypothetical protein